LRQIIINLAGNAIKFTESGGVTVSVEIESAEADRLRLHFVVRDTGIGIAPETQRVIFEPFSQADGSTTRKYGGTGLGLTISARLVRAMTGEIWVESALGKGSAFHFTASFGVAAAMGQGAAVDSGDSVAGPGVSRGARILLAEDNPVNRRVALRILEKGGYEVAVAGNGREVLQAIEREEFELILMDVQMPEMDGLEATGIVRERERQTGAHLPIIAMTAHAMSGDRERCLAAGMDEYISKPIHAEQLIELVRQHAHPAGCRFPVA
jgi:CheY-like chemotaxis protein